MSKWGASETGILRKKVVVENHDTLLVFGYACKLFRDDDKAKYIDQGKHLIPWMADDSLKIDRYDGRGALSDLKPYEASREGYDATRWLGLSESERKIEQLCDEERYYSLRTNEEEEAMYKEEELKRQRTNNEFAFNYDVPKNPQNISETPTVEEEDKDYVPRPELDVPVDIAIPKKEKENARIEKTAHFVSKQGPQMEILIKTKQAGNPQFSFLNQDDPLYKYYKHVLNAVKVGRYVVEAAKEEGLKAEGSDRDQSDEHYLHPSLLQNPVQQQHLQQPHGAFPLPLAAPATTTTSATNLVTAPVYKPTADCAYSQLVNRIQGFSAVQNNSLPDVVVGAAAVGKQPPPDQPTPPTASATYEQQQQYYQYYYSLQYYEYYKQLVQQYHSMGGTDGQTIPPSALEQITNQAAAFAQIAITQYVQQQQQQQHHQQQTNNANNPYAQLVSNLSHVKVPLTSTSGETTSAPQQEIDRQPPPEVAKPENQSNVENSETGGGLIGTKRNILGLVHYGSESDDDDDNNEDEVDERVQPEVVSPPEEIRLVIEKMASYVAKNGSDFESIVKSKGDARFNFLLDDHVYHRYYKLKVVEFGKRPSTPEVAVGKSNVTNGTTTASVVKDKPKDKKVIAPVSFSIKKPKEEIPKDIKSALPLEESDEDQPEVITANSTQTQSSQQTLSSSSPLSTQSITTTTTNISSSTLSDSPSFQSACPTSQIKQQSEQSFVEKSSDPDPILEMIDLTEELEDRKGARRAEDRIKDKLAAAAREKMALAAKDRALQLERRKKAAAFLRLKAAGGDQPDDTLVKKDDGGGGGVVAEDKVLVVLSDTESKTTAAVVKEKRGRKDGNDRRNDEKSDSEDDGEVRKTRKSKKKRSYHHKRKRSRSRKRSNSSHKKSKKKRKRSESRSSTSSKD